MKPISFCSSLHAAAASTFSIGLALCAAGSPIIASPTGYSLTKGDLNGAVLEPAAFTAKQAYERVEASQQLVIGILLVLLGLFLHALAKAYLERSALASIEGGGIGGTWKGIRTMLHM